MRMRMSTMDVGMRLGDATDPFHLANGFEAVIGYECQERSMLLHEERPGPCLVPSNRTLHYLNTGIVTTVD
jgi:hypothetical protein